MFKAINQTGCVARDANHNILLRLFLTGQGRAMISNAAKGKGA